MSVEPTIKLNLKALKTHNSADSDTVDIAPKTDTPVMDSHNDSVDTPIEPSTDQESSVNESKSHNISFADLKKQIDSKKNTSENIEKSQETEEQNTIEQVWKDDIASEVKTKETKIDENISETPKTEWVEQNIAQSKASNTKSNEISEDSENIKTVQTNEKNEKNEKNAVKKTKKSLFSRFSRKKSHTKLDTTVDEKNTSEPRWIAATDDASQKEITESKPGEKIHFSNYESHFKKESTNFLKRFQNFKYAPSTRIGMIWGLISITIISIASLMIVFPEKHSLSIYKASILEITAGRDLSSQNTNPKDSPVTPEEKIEDIAIEQDPQIDDENLDNIDIDTSHSHKETSKEILRQHLLNKYK